MLQFFYSFCVVFHLVLIVMYAASILLNIVEQSQNFSPVIHQKIHPAYILVTVEQHQDICESNRISLHLKICNIY